MGVAVVGHVEWVDFARVEQVPVPGEIVHVQGAWEQAAGGGAVAAVQMARLAGGCLFLTALGDDERGRAAAKELESMGVRVEAAWRREPQRRAFVHLDSRGERTITVIGDRLGPRGDDDLPWPELRDADGVYLTAGDAAAVRIARGARALVATARALGSLREAQVELDVLVASAHDAGERYRPGDLDPPPRLVAMTDGAAGGSLLAADGGRSRWAAAPLPGPLVDCYGAGDSFAAGLTYGLAEGLPPDEALSVGARCGAACVTGRGPYANQITRSAAIAPNRSAR